MERKSKIQITRKETLHVHLLFNNMLLNTLVKEEEKGGIV